MRSVDQAELEAWLPGAMARVAERARASGGLLGTADWPFLERAGNPNGLAVARAPREIYSANGPEPVCRYSWLLATPPPLRAAAQDFLAVSR
jgi:hypothetical protein